MNGDFHSLARRLGLNGRYGDTMVAHISPAEATILKLLGGSGTRNPRTGLLEFWNNAGGPGGAGFGGGGPSAGGGGIAGGGHGGDIGGGSNAGKGKGHVGPHGPMGGGTGAFTGGASPGLGVGSTGAPVSERQAVIRAGYQNALDDYGDDDNSFGEDVANAIGSLLGISEIDPATLGMGAYDAQDPANDIRTDGGVAEGADWGFDYGSALAGVLGRVAGVPFASQAYDLARYGLQQAGLLGPNFGIADFGPDPFGGSQTSTQNAGGGMVADGPGAGNTRIGNASGGQGASSNAGGGLVAISDPSNAGSAAPPPPVPAGLLQYLAQNPPYLPGHTGMTRFGTGAVPPFDYYRPIA